MHIGKKSKIKKRIEIICVVIVLLFGIGLVSFSSVITFISDYSQTKVIDEYEYYLNQQKQESIDRVKKDSENHNESITKIVSNDKDSKEEKKQNNKAVFKNGEMEGYITIPSINVALPVYEGTKESSLYQGAGHVSTSSFPKPNKKKGTHCVFVGHSALSSATLFDNLDQMNIGDVFYVKFLDESYKYKVDKIIPSVKPDNVDQYIQNQEGKNYCTLITCTPKTINSHRLLVRGINVPMNKNEVHNNKMLDFVKQKEQQMNNVIYLIVACIVFVVIVILIIIFLITKKKKRKNNHKE